MGTRATLYNIHKDDIKDVHSMEDYYTDEHYDVLTRETILFDWFCDYFLNLYSKENDNNQYLTLVCENDDGILFTINKDQFWNCVKTKMKQIIASGQHNSSLSESYDILTVQYMDNSRDNKWIITQNSIGMTAAYQLLHIYKVMDWDNDLVLLHIG